MRTGTPGVVAQILQCLNTSIRLLSTTVYREIGTMIRTRSSHSLILSWTVLLSMAAPGLAQDEQPFYVGGELGALLSPAVTMVGDSNDRASVCDEFINPLYASVPGCTDRARGVGDSWNVPFDGTIGVLAGAVVGYRLHRMARVEVEYLMRTSGYSEHSGVLAAQGVNADKLSDELFLAQEWLGLVSSKSLMGNVYLDLPDVVEGATPFLGLGIGIGTTSADYASVWSRNTDPGAIATGRDQPNFEQIARNLAGTSSSGRTTMTDTQISYQLLAGFDYPLVDAVSMDVRARWMTSGEFTGTIVWDPLRSHVPNLRRDGSEPVDGTMSTDDFSFTGISIGVKYHF